MYLFFPRTVAKEACPSNFDTLEMTPLAPGEGDPSGKIYSAVRSAAFNVSSAHDETSRSSHVPV
jgi:hypothetical protein